MTARILVPTFSGLSGPSRRRGIDLSRASRVIVTRSELAETEPRMLRDVGLTEADAAWELRRAPWDTEPRHPHRRRKQPPSRAAALRSWLDDAWRRYRSRQLLTQMDAAALRDIGLTYADAEAEANKPFWRA